MKSDMELWEESQQEARARDWATRVLDAYCSSFAATVTISPKPWGWEMRFGSPPQSCSGKTADAARLNAALCVFKTLSEATRKVLGECP